MLMLLLFYRIGVSIYYQNINQLAERFAKGACEAGYNIEEVSLSDKDYSTIQRPMLWVLDEKLIQTFMSLRLSLIYSRASSEVWQ